MAKMMTPAMERINKRRAKSGGKIKRSTPGLDAWRRLIRNKPAILGMVIIVALLLMAALAPLIAVQIMGLVYVHRSKSAPRSGDIPLAEDSVIDLEEETL